MIYQDGANLLGHFCTVLGTREATRSGVCLTPSPCTAPYTWQLPARLKYSFYNKMPLDCVLCWHYLIYSI